MNHTTRDATGRIKGLVVVGGEVEGEVVSTRVPLSLWGGLDPANGKIIDIYHPLNGVDISGKIFVLPEGRGSCTGSGVLLEAIMSGNAPSGIIMHEKDEVITLGGIVSSEVFSKHIPIIILNEADFEEVLYAPYIKIDTDGYVTLKE